jgi:nitrate reductase gamma subunit
MSGLFQWFILLFGWVSILLFIALAAYKIYRIATLPLNLRWEVYPVPHEPKDRRSYGGSYMEQVDWSKRPRITSVLAELGEMGAEIFFLNRVRKHNPYHLWPLSMAMHWGIYLLLAWIGLLAAAYWVPVLDPVAVVVGGAALLLGVCGTLGLIVKRATNKALSLYTTPVDYFNLAFLATIFGLGLASWAADPGFSQHQAYLVNLITFETAAIPPAVVAMFFLLQAFAIYMPLSKLIHYVMKHFTFTEILWDDAFKAKDSARDKRVARQLAYTKDWSAPHIGQGRTWLEDAQETSATEEGER